MSHKDRIRYNVKTMNSSELKDSLILETTILSGTSLLKLKVVNIGVLSKTPILGKRDCVLSITQMDMQLCNRIQKRWAKALLRFHLLEQSSRI